MLTDIHSFIHPFIHPLWATASWSGAVWGRGLLRGTSSLSQEEEEEEEEELRPVPRSLWPVLSLVDL